MYVLSHVLQLYKNYQPLKCFGLVAMLLILVAMILFIPVGMEYMKVGLVPRFPTLIVCGFMVLAGIQSLFAGIILDVTVAKDKRDFEYRLNRVNTEKKRKTLQVLRELCDTLWRDFARHIRIVKSY